MGDHGFEVVTQVARQPLLRQFAPSRRCIIAAATAVVTGFSRGCALARSLSTIWRSSSRAISRRADSTRLARASVNTTPAAARIGGTELEHGTDAGPGLLLSVPSVAAIAASTSALGPSPRGRDGAPGNWSRQCR